MRRDSLISYAELERLGWPQFLIDDYLGRLDELTPQSGTTADPNGVYFANLNGFYVKNDPAATPPTALWFNPSPGANTGWIQLA